jgi:uncharacterized protein (TIGR02284 family)
MEGCNDKMISVMRELLEFVNDGAKGYKTAADETNDDHIRSFCLEHALQREQFAVELNAILKKCGSDPEKSGTIKGALYRQWMDVKATLTNSDDEAIIASCLYGEEWALKAYNDALDSDNGLTPEAARIIMQQRDKVLRAYEELKEMESLHHH